MYTVIKIVNKHFSKNNLSEQTRTPKMPETYIPC